MLCATRAFAQVPHAVGNGHAGGAQPGEGEHHRPPQPGAGDHHADHDLRRGLLRLCDLSLRPPAQSGAEPTSHNTVLEIAWTVVPVLILVMIAIPSFRLVYFEDRAPDADMTIKVTGHQWYWEYTYPDQGNIDFSSYMVPTDQLQAGPAAAARRGQPARAARREDDPHSHDERRRDPQLLHPEPRRAAVCDPGTHDRDLGEDRPARRLLWRVQPDLRHEPQPACRFRFTPVARRVRRLGATGQDEVRRRRRASCAADRAGSSRRRARSPLRRFSTDPHARVSRRRRDERYHARPRASRRSRPRPRARVRASLADEHEPQGYRHPLSDLRGVRGHRRRRACRS